MELVLLGTGAADGWPNPFCSCASCVDALASGEIRGQTSVLVDGVLLLDCGPEVPRAALRLGHRLSGVRHVLVTHAHPDHAGPAALLWRAWAGRREHLDWVGPEPVLAEARMWAGPEDPVVFRSVSPGDELDLGGYRVRVLEATHGPQACLYEVTGPDGARLLYATDTGTLPGSTVDALRGRHLDAVLMEETFGDRTGHGTDHLDLASFPRQLAALREAGALDERTTVVPVHLGHHNPPGGRLAQRMAAWGARVLPDGAHISLVRESPSPPPGSAPPRRTLVLGGARSGKSSLAEELLAAEPTVTYLATSGVRDGDPEWLDRVAAHQARRPAGWTTVETLDVAAELRRATAPVLVDCLALWLTGVMDDAGAWDDSPGSEQAVAGAVSELLAAWDAAEVRVVAVSNEVGSGVVPATRAGRRFRDELGRLNVAVAARSERVVLCVSGLPVELTAPRPRADAAPRPRADTAPPSPIDAVPTAMPLEHP